MSADDDKYPEASDRRRFVKGVVGGAVLAGLGTSASAMVSTTTTRTGAGGGITEYFGIENVDGPAPRAMPQIPIEIDEEGFVRGMFPEPQEIQQGGRTVTVARMQLAGITYSNEWFQYCGVQTYPGLDPEFESDNYFRYTASPPYEWQQEAVSAGDRVNVADFDDFENWGNVVGQPGLGKPAFATWRSQGVPPQATIPVQLIRSSIVDEMADESQWLSASTQDGFIAIMDKCTHFCCVPGFKAFQDAGKFDAEDLVYCQCHQSVYDPFSVVQQQFVALPRPEE